MGERSGHSEDKPFYLIAREIVANKKRDSNLSPKRVAGDLGIKYVMFKRWLEGDKYHIHAEKLPLLCKLLDDFTLLDHLEEQAGRLAFVVPDIEEPLHSEDLIAVQRLVKEVGEALQSLANTLADQLVEEWELKETIPKLDAVIRECTRIKHWLEVRSRVDMEKIRATKQGGA